MISRSYIDRREAADYLTERGFKTSWRTLQKQASTGGGPRYYIYGNKALYRPEDLDSHVGEKLSAPRRSTAEAAY